MTRSFGTLIALFAAMIALGARADLLVDNFDDGSDCGWQQVGDSHSIAGYDKRPVAPGRESPFALRVQKNEVQGWCGVGTPDLSRLDLTGATAVRFWARNAGGCGRLLVDFHQKDGTRWWRKVDLPQDGAWVEVVNTPETLFRVEGQGEAKTPDFTKWGALWLSVDDAQRAGAAFDVDEVIVAGAKAPTPPPFTAPTIKPPDLKINGKPKVIILDTPGNPFATAMRDALAPVAGPVEIVAAADFVARVDPGPTRQGHSAPTAIAIVGTSQLPPGAGPALRRFVDAGQALWYQATALIGPPDARELLLHAPVFGRHWVELERKASTDGR